jgi:hypothetical protein
LRNSRQSALLAAGLSLGILLYIAATVLSFDADDPTSGLSPLPTLALTFATGLGALSLGYGLTILLGGQASLPLVEHMAHLTRSTHVVEIVDELHRPKGWRCLRDISLYLPVLIFVMSITLAWDVHNFHSPEFPVLHDLLHQLDIFSKPVQPSVWRHAVDFIPPMIIFVAAAGAVPSLVLPYYRRFKITSVNSDPFHTDLLLSTLGLLAGFGALLSLGGYLFKVLWWGNGPRYYEYVLPTMLGLSIHYTIGAFLARDRSEKMVVAKLEDHTTMRIVKGTVRIEESTPDDTR